MINKRKDYFFISFGEILYIHNIKKIQYFLPNISKTYPPIRLEIIEGIVLKLLILLENLVASS